MATSLAVACHYCGAAAGDRCRVRELAGVLERPTSAHKVRVEDGLKLKNKGLVRTGNGWKVQT